MGKKICAVAALVLGAVALAAIGAPASAAGVNRRCDAHRAYAKDSVALVYRRPSGHDDGVGNPQTVYYACARPGGASIAVASDSSPGVGEYPPNDILRELRLAGRFVASIMVQGEGDQSSCQKYGQPNCPTPETVLRAADARTRRLYTRSVPSGSHGLVLAPSTSSPGAIAWLEPASSGSTLMAGVLIDRKGQLQSAPYELDAGAISHVRLTGTSITWLNGSVKHRASVSYTG